MIPENNNFLHICVPVLALYFVVWNSRLLMTFYKACIIIRGAKIGPEPKEDPETHDLALRDYMKHTTEVLKEPTKF